MLPTSSRASFASIAALALMAGLLGGAMTSANPATSPFDRAGQAEAERNAGQKSPAKNSRSFASLMQAIGTGYGSGSRGSQRRAGPGWSNRHVKRMAVKARNVKRHRANNRG